jgi:hypothetical protein
VIEKVHQGISPGLRLVEAGIPIKTAGGTIGTLDYLVNDSVTKGIPYLVVQRGLVSAELVAVPAQSIQYIGKNSITVDLTDWEVNQLAQINSDQ